MARFEYDNDLEEKKNQKKDHFGWEVFNDDAQYNAYKKRCTALQKNKERYDAQMDIGNDLEPTEEAQDRLVQDLNK